MTTLPVYISSSLDEACNLFQGDLKAWAYSCIDRYHDEPPTNSHDQLTYCTAWEPYILASQDEHLMQFMTTAQEAVASHFASKDEWRHGYWRMSEAHHGSEHFELFLGFMTRIAPGNPTTLHQLVDAVEHIGNWSEDVPEWFDYSTGLFRSLYFGADGVRTDEDELNMPDHLRCTNLLMLSYNVTHDSKYLELAETYCERWATAICAHDRPLPIGITRHGVIHELSGQDEDTYRSFAGMAGELDTELDRAENILASGGIQLFLQLWQESHNDVFLNASTRLLTILSSALSDADSGPVADAIRTFRRVTGKVDFDQQVTQLVGELAPLDISSIGVDLSPHTGRRPPGVGKRADMPVWSEDDCPRRHNPILLSLAAEISEDSELATRAVDLARTYFNLAVQLMPDGRHHGCAARTVSAIARGHGRNNHAGMTTAVLLPIIKTFDIQK